MKFPDILRSLRIERGLNQTDFATAIGVSRSTIGMYETGKREPDFETLESIADYFNVSMLYLLGKSDIKSHQPTSEDDEMLQLLDELRSRPEMKMLFSVSKKCTPEEVQQAVKIIEALRKDTNNE